MSGSARQVRVEIFGRAGCGLCDEAKAVIAPLRDELGFELVEVDIAQDAALEQAYGWDIPVIHVAGQRAFQHRVDPAALRGQVLRAAEELR